VRLDPERRERRRHRIGDDAADRDDAAFAGALGAERVGGRGLLLERHRPDVGEVAGGRQEIVGERAGQQLTLGVVDEMLQERAAETLHDGADRLPVQGERVDDAADVLDRHVVDELDMAGLGVDRDMRGMGAVAVGALVAGIGGLRR
jgi:hypothetical protein